MEDDGSPAFLGVIIFVVGLSCFSWRYVEVPFRNGRLFAGRRIFRFGILGIGFFAIVGYLGYRSNGFEEFYLQNRVGAENARLIAYLNYNETDEFRRSYRAGSCFYGSEFGSFEQYDRKACLRLSEDKPNYLLVGDSHAAHWIDALIESYPNVGILQATASGCRPVIPYRGQKRCTDLIRSVYESFLPNTSLDGVIISARWQMEDVEAVFNTARYLLTFVPRVIVLGPTVEYRHPLPLFLHRHNEVNAKASSKILASVVDGRSAVSNAMMMRLRNSRVEYLSVYREVCSDEACRVTTDEGIPIVWDYGHFTKDGAHFLVKGFLSAGLLHLN